MSTTCPWHAIFADLAPVCHVAHPPAHPPVPPAVMIAPLVPAALMTMWTHWLESLRPLRPADVPDIHGQLHNMVAWYERAQFLSTLPGLFDMPAGLSNLADLCQQRVVAAQNQGNHAMCLHTHHHPPALPSAITFDSFGPANLVEKFKLWHDRLLPPEDTNEYLLPPVCTQDGPRRRLIAVESIIRRKEHMMAVLLDREEIFLELVSDKTGALYKVVALPAFGQVVQVTMAKSIAVCSKLKSVCNADTDATRCRMANDYAFVIEKRRMVVPDREITIELAVRLGLPLSYNCDATVPLNPPSSAYSHGTGNGSDDGAVWPDSAKDEELIDLAKHYLTALLLSTTNLTDLVALVRALAKLCMKQIDALKAEVDALKAEGDALQAQVDALQAN
ncbi:hypothetical protein AMAG_00954 [Allomyces macrogynus ATCC 38327]|uniref:Uncharacterized protein n=1 Tax=Allomyces macrogynus (strain ATCC 38327) TaxID=578462 RepID=A0A0L0RXB4_ALLM3|nr:hypothetical protein AMAG_00954 [Allomyces macrogynus ATCC 38327]|eukprot:KNE55017.1 hypothetical protein AMAG_00954 [Allomyces macrogynus ATCC 38327]